MFRLTDQHYLRNQQYKTPGNLEARIALHRRFGTTHEDWFYWIFERIAPQPNDLILELGCGPGDLWRETAAMFPGNLTILLGDLSPGMLLQARQVFPTTAGTGYAVLDAQNLPLPGSILDIVVANHMLYHVPDISKALSEIFRVLKPGGRLLAATNGANHMAQLDDLIHKHTPEFGGLRAGALRFSLENAVEVLSPFFSDARVEIFANDLKVTEAAPVADYVRSNWDAYSAGSNVHLMEAILADVEAEINTHGYFYIAKSQGLVMANKKA